MKRAFAAVLVAAVASLTMAASTEKFVKRLEADLDRDGRIDSLELFCATEEYCNGERYFDVAKLDLSTSGLHVLRSDVGWQQLESNESVFPQPNLFGSPFAYAHRFGPAGTLMFLFGQPEGGSSGPGVSVFAIGSAGVRKYFEPYEFYPVRFVAPAAGNRPWRMLAALSTSEAFGDPDFPDADLGTYAPVTVFILGKTISIDEAETERHARREFGAYAGPKPREDVVVVQEHHPPRRYLIYWPSRKRVE